MKLYIAGPMTGIEEYNYPAFFEAACKLALEGYQPLNPANIGVQPHFAHSVYIKAGIELLLQADHVATLVGWERSRGARLEVDVARACGMDVYDIDHWLIAYRRERT